MKAHSLLSTVLLLAGGIYANAIDMPTTEFNYDVQYKWGVIDVAIGHGVANVTIDNDQLHGTLNGQTIPWEGRIFSIGDELTAAMSPTSQNNQYINGVYRKPKAGEDEDPNDPANYKSILGEGELNASPETMEAVSVTANMIGMFYFAKAIDFESLSPGDQVEIEIINPEGQNAADHMLITYRGKGDSKAGMPQEVYEVLFNYSLGGQYTDYPVICEISTDQLVPIYFGADLKIGHVDMYLTD